MTTLFIRHPRTNPMFVVVQLDKMHLQHIAMLDQPHFSSTNPVELSLRNLIQEIFVENISFHTLK